MNYNLDFEFQKLRKEFIESLQGDLNEIEDLVNDIQKSEVPSSVLGKVMGRIHSIKGVAGSYEYPSVSSLCHIIEDHLNIHQIADSGNWEAIADLLFKDLDQLKVLVAAYLNDDTAQVEAIQAKYKLKSKSPHLHGTKKMDTATHENDKLRILLVESSQIIVKLVQDAVKKMNVEIAFSNTAYEALGRLLNEQFDFLITNQMTDSLTGLTLINTIHLNQGINKDIKSILISGSDFDSIKGDFPYGPNYFLKKDIHLTDELSKIWKAILDNSTYVPRKLKESPKKQILLLDDAQDIHKLVEISIKKMPNLHLKSAKTISEALELMSKIRPDLILLDVHLDKEDGRDCFLTIKNNPEYADIPIVFLTGISEAAELNALQKLGAQGIIQKPFDVKELKNRILENLGPTLLAG